MFPAMPAAALCVYPCASRKLTIAVTFAGSMPREVSHVSAVVVALAGAFAAAAVADATGVAGAFAACAAGALAACAAAALFATSPSTRREEVLLDTIASARLPVPALPVSPARRATPAP